MECVEQLKIDWTSKLAVCYNYAGYKYKEPPLMVLFKLKKSIIKSRHRNNPSLHDMQSSKRELNVWYQEEPLLWALKG